LKINNITYHLTNFQNLKKIAYACLFFVLLAANPIVRITNAIQDVTYELVDASEKEENSKQETVSELDNETKFLQTSNAISFQKELIKQTSCFMTQSSFLSYKQDIQLPPPRVI